MRVYALYMVLFPALFLVGGLLQRAPEMVSMPLGFMLLLYFPALLTLIKTRSPREAFSLDTYRDGIYLMAIFAGVIVIGIFSPGIDKNTRFKMVYSVILCVKAITIFRDRPAEDATVEAASLEAAPVKVKGGRKSRKHRTE